MRPLLCNVGFLVPRSAGAGAHSVLLFQEALGLLAFLFFQTSLESSLGIIAGYLGVVLDGTLLTHEPFASRSVKATTLTANRAALLVVGLGRDLVVVVPAGGSLSVLWETLDLSGLASAGLIEGLALIRCGLGLDSGVSVGAAVDYEMVTVFRLVPLMLTTAGVIVTESRFQVFSAFGSAIVDVSTADNRRLLGVDLAHVVPGA